MWCVWRPPTLGRGHADYGRFVRRHSHLNAPCEDGTIETGPSHAHPELSPYGPPSEDRFMAINVEQQARPATVTQRQEHWGCGAAISSVDLDALVVRNPVRVSGHATVGTLTLGDVAPLGRGWWAAALSAVGIGARRRYPAALPLEWATAAVCEAYVALGERTPEAMASTQFAVDPRAGCRSAYPTVPSRRARAVSAAVDELLGEKARRGLANRTCHATRTEDSAGFVPGLPLTATELACYSPAPLAR